MPNGELTCETIQYGVEQGYGGTFNRAIHYDLLLTSNSEHVINAHAQIVCVKPLRAPTVCSLLASRFGLPPRLHQTGAMVC